MIDDYKDNKDVLVGMGSTSCDHSRVPLHEKCVDLSDCTINDVIYCRVEYKRGQTMDDVEDNHFSIKNNIYSFIVLFCSKTCTCYKTTIGTVKISK